MANPRITTVNLIMVLFFVSKCIDNSIEREEVPPLITKLIHNFSDVIQTPFTDDMTMIVAPFQFLSKTGPDQNCFQTETTKITEFLYSPQFYARAKSFDPRNFKADLDSYLSAVIESEIQKIKAYYELHKRKMLESFELNQASVLHTVKRGFQCETIAVFSAIYETKVCEANLPKIQKLKEQLTKAEIDTTFLFKHGRHSFSSEFYLNLFLEESACHKQVFETLFPRPVEDFLNKVSRHVDTCFLNPLFSKELLNFHSDYKNLATRDEPEYVRFIDTYVASSHVSHDIRYYFLNPLYFNLKAFEPFFEFYRSEFIEEFSRLYDLIVDFRIAQRGSITGLTIQQLAKELDAFLETKKTRKVRLISKILIAFFASENDQILSENFKAYEIDGEYVRLFFRYNNRLKKFARAVDRNHNLLLEINDFEDMVRLSLEKNGPIDYDGFFGDSRKVKKILTRAEPSIKEFLFKLSKSTNPEDNALVTRIINELLSWISNITPIEKLPKQEYDSLRNKIFELLLEFTQSDFKKLLVTLFEQTESESSRLLRAFNKFIVFINNENVQTKLESLVKKLEASDYLAICSELYTDVQGFKNVPIKVCEGKNFDKHLFQTNFSAQFTKLISFLRMFEYYRYDYQSDVFYYELYILILINKSFIKLGSEPEAYLLNFDRVVRDSVIANTATRKLKDLMRDPEIMHDLSRIINLNSFFENDLLRLKAAVQDVKFDTILFVNIASIFKFYRIADTKTAFVSHLQRIFEVFKGSEAHYHFNNIYMLTQFYIYSLDKQLESSALVSQLTGMYQIINPFTESMDNNPIKKSDIRVSKVEATFYFAEYLSRTYRKEVENLTEAELQKNQEISDNFIHFFKTAFYALTDIEKILFVARNFNKNAKLDIFSNVEGLKQPYNQKAIQETNKGKFVEHFFQKHARSEYPSGHKNGLINLEVFAHIAFDYFFILYEKNFIDSITEHQAWKYMIPHFFKLYYRKRVLNYKSQATKLYGLVSEQDFQTHDNLYLMTHFIFNKAISNFNELKGIEVPETEFKTMFDQFVDNFYSDYAVEVQKYASVTEFDDLKFFTQNLYIIHKVIFARIFELPLDPKANNVKIDRLKVPAAAVYFQNSKSNGDFFDLQKTESSPAWVKSVRDFNLSSVRKAHQFDNFLEFEIRDIFSDGCRYEEFNAYIRVREVDSNMDFLGKIVRRCINHPKNFINDKGVNVNERETYKLLKALTVNDPEYNGNKLELSFKKEQLFEQVWVKAKLILEKNSLHSLLKSIILKDKNYVVEANYIEFVKNVLRFVNLEQLGWLYEDSSDLKLVSRELKDEIINHYLKDFFSFYDPEYEYKFGLDELSGSRIFKIVTINSEAIYPLTRLASDVKYARSQLSLMFSLYFVASEFRYLKISTSSEDPMKYVNNNEAFNVDFEKFLVQIQGQATDKKAEAIVLYMKLVHFAYNVRRLQDFNFENTFNCALIKQLKYISEAANLENVDFEAFAELLSSNTSFRHNLMTYNAKAKELIALKDTLQKSSQTRGIIKSSGITISSKFDNCEPDVKNMYSVVLENWVKFSSKVFPDGSGVSESNYFTASKNIVHISRPVNAFSNNPDKNYV